MKNTIKIVGLTVIFFGITISGFSQSFYKERIPKTDILSFGIGPSFIYADNAGQYKRLNFKINPALSLGYTKKINNRFAIKSTAGVQFIESGGNPTPAAVQIWEENGSAMAFNGEVYFLDVMPVMYLLPFHSHMNRSFINFYGGLGIGLIHVNRTQLFSFDENSLESRASTTSAYVPIRAGISFRLGDLSDLALEGTMLLTFSDNLDGNQNYNRFNDHLAQAQIVYKRFLNTKSRK